MQFYEITVRHKREGRVNVTELRQLIADVGGLRRSANEPMASVEHACRILSRHASVEMVTITRIEENNAGMWRNGKKTGI